MATIIIKSEKATPLTQLMYGWSSYGGSNQGLVDEDLGQEWACQACGEYRSCDEQPFYFEFSPREFIKICELCHIKRIHRDILTLADLISLVRPPRSIF
jgi:hypothetical protein